MQRFFGNQRRENPLPAASRPSAAPIYLDPAVKADSSSPLNCVAPQWVARSWPIQSAIFVSPLFDAYGQAGRGEQSGVAVVSVDRAFLRLAFRRRSA